MQDQDRIAFSARDVAEEIMESFLAFPGLRSASSDVDIAAALNRFYGLQLGELDMSNVLDSAVDVGALERLIAPMRQWPLYLKTPDAHAKREIYQSIARLYSEGLASEPHYNHGPG